MDRTLRHAMSYHRMLNDHRAIFRSLLLPECPSTLNARKRKIGRHPLQVELCISNRSRQRVSAPLVVRRNEAVEVLLRSSSQESGDPIAIAGSIETDCRKTAD